VLGVWCLAPAISPEGARTLKIYGEQERLYLVAVMQPLFPVPASTENYRIAEKKFDFFFSIIYNGRGIG